ncbi:MAG TPA: polysaccharide biosynthesis/export family protein [Candidatus Binatia bacterium]|nr:polysaccharide biosynthesis/export family protein [Candidatus Binatia bacterium]
MEFGRFCLARGVSALAFFLALTSVSGAAQQQQAPTQSGDQNQSAAYPPVRSLTQAAVGSSGRVQTPPAGANDATADTRSTSVNVSETSPTLHLSSGDLVEVSVYNVPELTTKARIGSTGDVYLPLIDYVHVGDLTVEEAQRLIQKRLQDGGFVRDAHVTIFIDESASQGVTVIGEVMRPGIYPALGDRRLYDLISAAGGFSISAGRKISVIHQNNPEPVTLNLPRNLADDLQENIEIQPGDTITVPRAPVVYVVGDVGHPTGLLVDNGNLTVLQALALAGGTNHTAKIGGTRIIHRGATGMTETHVPLKKMLEAKAPDINLQADDILFVPLSGARYAAGRGFEAAISAAAGLAIIAAHP